MVERIVQAHALIEVGLRRGHVGADLDVVVAEVIVQWRGISDFRRNGAEARGCGQNQGKAKAAQW
jgi:hypothetical protein